MSTTLHALRRRLVEGPTGRHRTNLVRVGAFGFLALVAIAVGGSYASVTGYLPFVPRGGNLVAAEFDSAFNLNTATPVRIKGIGVGTVEKIDVRDGGRAARVVMRIDDRSKRLLRSDARAAVWSKLVLGGTNYIELTPGRAAGALGDTTIPRNRTTTQVGIDEVVNSLTPGARTGLKKTIAGAQTIFSAPRTAGQAIDALDGGLKPLGPAVKALRGRNPGDLGELVSGFNEIVTALDRDESALSGIIDGAGATLAVTAAHRADLGATLRRAPGALKTTRTELAGLDRTLDILEPLARDLRPGARRAGPALLRLRPALTETRRLLADARPLVAALDPAVSSLGRAARRGVPLMDELQPSLTRANDSLLPFLHSKEPKTGVEQHQMVGPTVAAVDSLSGLFDADGHVAHFNPTVGGRVLHDYAPCEVYATDPDPSRRIACQDFTDFVLSLFTGKPAAPKTMGRLVTALGRRR
jgi:phospholipid/cholesterol/gamma-HCH transport system substrate-binding protein